MALKNYRSDMPVHRIFDSLTKQLVSHGARQISFEYDENGRATGLSFGIATPKGMRHIRVPARIDKVGAVLEQQRAEGWRNPDQVDRVAWKNIHDRIAAQMALLETDMVKLEEVFLPYMTDRSGRTFFEVVQDRGLLLESGDSNGEKEAAGHHGEWAQLRSAQAGEGSSRLGDCHLSGRRPRGIQTSGPR